MSIWDMTATGDRSEEFEEEVKKLEDIANRLYDELIFDTKKFSDFEYRFISHMFEEDKTILTEKQKENLYRLEEKYL